MNRQRFRGLLTSRDFLDSRQVEGGAAVGSSFLRQARADIRPRVIPVPWARQTLEADPKGQESCSKIYLVLVGLAVLRLWIMPITASFWLDETVTYWSVYKGIGASVSRSQFWSGQNLPYTLVAALAFRLGGPSEITLRLPSLLAALLAAWLLFQLATHFCDRETGLITLAVFASLQEMSLSAANARQYSIGLLMVVGSILQLVRWMNTGRRRNLAGFILFAAAIPYFHYFFASVYLVHALYALRRKWAGAVVRWAEICITAACVLVLTAPLLWNAIRVKHSAAESLSFLSKPHFEDLFVSFLPPVLGAGIFLGLLGGLLIWKYWRATEGPNLSSETIVLVLSWLTVPIATLFFVSRLTPYEVFLGRYYLPAFPAIALLVGCGIRSLALQKIRVLVSGCIVVAAIASFGGTHLLTVTPHGEDWRAAAVAIRAAGVTENTPVLFRTGLAETKVNSNLEVDHDSPYLSPLSKYPIPGRIVLAPFRLDNTTIGYLDDVSSRILEPSGEFVLVTRDDDSSLKWWLLGRFSDKGFVVSKIGKAVGVSAMWFRREP